jgi:hypothetical protein
VEPAGVAATPSSFYALTPCRLVDTRTAAGPFGGPALAFGESRPFTVSAGACGVPADAKAVSMNVTVTGQAAAGALTLFPGAGVAPVTTTVSFANNAVVGLTGGILSVLGRQESGSVDVIVDVSGYFR